MNRGDNKRKRNEARSKFRKEWIERKRVESKQRKSQDGEGLDTCFNLGDPIDFPLLNPNSEEKKIHPPKTKYAMAFGYLGTSYHGYQKQVEYKTGLMDKVKTIEGTLENCLIEIGAIHESFRNMTHKLQMSKTSRTDKGVHAACTYIGGRLNLDFKEKISELENGHTNKDQNIGLIGNGVKKKEYKYNNNDGEMTKEEIFIERFNSILPQDIRCFKIQRVTKGFDARSMCSKRKYEYVLPEWILCRAYKVPDEHLPYLRKLEQYFEDNLNNKEVIKFTKLNESLYEVKGGYIECEPDIEKFEKILKQYEGTHDFHNFTVRQKIESGNTKRYIQKICVKTDNLDELKVVKILIVGQSFLYNQIRKMVSLAIQIYLEICPQNSLRFSLNKSHFLNLNIVPSEGLILHHPYFDSYNITRCNPPEVPYIDYKEIKPCVEMFKTQYIYPEIKRSIYSNIWEKWLECLENYPFYLENGINSDGESLK